MGALDAANWEKWYGKPDLQKTDTAAAAKAAEKSNDSFDITIKVPLTRANKIFSFWFQYEYQDPETLLLSLGPRSPIVTYGFDIPNLTKGVQGLTLTAGFKSYGVKFTIDPTSVQEDIVIFESLTADFANQYIVYVGNSTNVSINTSDFAPRWVKVRSRDKWLTQNNTDVIAVGPDAGGSVTPKNADPDTSTPPSAPTGATPYPFIDANDKTGFSAGSTFTWNQNVDTNTAGYVIRWTTQNPATTPNPIWEYGQVDGKTTTSFTTTGLIPNTLYYYQVTAKSPYNAISWASPFSGTFGPIIDPDAPADVWAQLKSVLSIGGKTADLFKIGTGIAQSINTSTTITPSQTAGTYSGIILNKSTTNFGHNFWLNTGQFRVGSATAFMYWNGSDLFTTGKINATGGSFTGDVQLNGGSLFAGAAANSGARVRINSSGLFAYDTNNAQTVAITQADGKLDARQGYIGGWTINGTAQTTGSIFSSNTKLESNGTITLGDTTGTIPSVVKLSATDTYRLWVGSQSSSAAAFKVDLNGKLYATGAVIDGSASISGSVTIGGTAASTVVSNASAGANALQANGTFTGTLGTGVTINGNNLNTRLTDAFTKSNAALPASGFNRDKIVEFINSTTSNPTNTTTIEGGLIRTGTISSDAVVTNFIAAFEIAAEKIKAGTLSGQTLVAGSGTSFINTKGNLGGADCLSIGGIGFQSTSTGGWTTHCYPYWGGGANYDLGTATFRWNDLRASGNVMVGHGGSDTQGNASGPKTKLLASGNIYANTLGTTTSAPGSGSTVVQDSSGYLRVYVTSSSRQYKENIEYQNTSSMYNILSSLSPVKFNFKSDYSDRPDETHLGLIAEDVHDIEANNDLVIYKDGVPESVAYEKIPMYLAGAFKEMVNKIDTLQARLDALEG
jgi:hypothetical protein